MRALQRGQLTRRSAMRGLAGAAAAAALPAALRAAASPLEERPSLRDLSFGIKFGCAASAPSEQPDAMLLQKIAAEANIFVPEGHLKWDMTEPRPGEFSFAGADSIADFAGRHGMSVHGHTLVWYAAIPDWVARLATARDAALALERHIDALVKRYRGHVSAWDVVNEPVEPHDGIENGYRNSIWLRLMGIDYVERAFRLARGADPQTPLCLNEYGFEYATAECRQRRQDILALLRRLKDRNTPVDVFGLQSHLDAHLAFDRKELTTFLRAVSDLGVRFMVTELDVNDVRIAGSEGERDATVARHVDDYLDIVFSVARPLSISTWGLSDRYTWLRLYNKRPDGSTLRPLPLDANFNRKPFWAVLAKYVT
jgi:endo-1,4-beta-xylanase